MKQIHVLFQELYFVPFISCGWTQFQEHEQKRGFVTPVSESIIFSSHPVLLSPHRFVMNKHCCLFSFPAAWHNNTPPLCPSQPPLRLLIKLFSCQEEEKESPTEFILMSIPPHHGPKSSTWTTCRTTSEGMNAMAPLVEASKHRADLIRVFKLVGFSVRSVFLSSSGAQLIFHIPQIPCSWSHWNLCSSCSIKHALSSSSSQFEWIWVVMCQTQPMLSAETICQVMNSV